MEQKKNFFLRKKIDVLISPKETIEIFTDKWITYKNFKKYNIPTPETSLQKKFQLVKPRKGRGAKGIIISDDNNINMEGNISQEIVQGEELTIDCLFDKSGIPIYIIPRKRLKIINGKSINSKTVQNKMVVKYIEELAKNLHFIGPINFQCFVDQKEIWFIEVNPRIAGGWLLVGRHQKIGLTCGLIKLKNNHLKQKNQIWIINVSIL